MRGRRGYRGQVAGDGFGKTFIGGDAGGDVEGDERFAGAGGTGEEDDFASGEAVFPEPTRGEGREVGEAAGGGDEVGHGGSFHKEARTLNLEFGIKVPAHHLKVAGRCGGVVAATVLLRRLGYRHSCGEIMVFAEHLALGVFYHKDTKTQSRKGMTISHPGAGRDKLRAQRAQSLRLIFTDH